MVPTRFSGRSEAAPLFGCIGLLALIILSPLTAGGVPARLAHDGHDEELPERTMKIDENGQVKLPEDMLLAQVLIRKGKYIVTHDIDGAEHWFTFSPVPDPSAEDHFAEPVKVKASRLPARETLKTSLIYAWPDGHEYRIVKIQLAREAEEYLF